MKRIMTFFIVLVLPMLSFGNDQPGVLFKKGNTWYAKAQYKEALGAYKQVLADGYQSASLYFNMGNASYKLDATPAALLYYEKAHKLAPGDDDINFNIRLANLKTTDKVEEIPEFFLTRWWKGFILALTLNALAAISIILFFIASGLLILYFFAGSFLVKKTSFIASLAVFFIGIITVFIANRQVSYFDSHHQAIVFNSSVTVKSAPADHSNSLFVIHDGTKVNILDSSNGWMKIRLANGNEGWLKANDIKEI